MRYGLTKVAGVLWSVGAQALESLDIKENINSVVGRSSKFFVLVRNLFYFCPFEQKELWWKNTLLKSRFELSSAPDIVGQD